MTEMTAFLRASTVEASTVTGHHVEGSTEDIIRELLNQDCSILFCGEVIYVHL